MALELALVGRGLPDEVDRQLLKRAVAATERLAGPGAGKINLKLVDDEGIRALNKKYGNSDKATDVLSFSYTEDGSSPIEGELGDIAISVETARRQAKTAGTDLATEIALLLVHGVLHILGYDHASPKDQAAVETLQSQIMKQLNLTYRNFKWDSSVV